MILPTTYATAMLLTILSMICWGSWANTFKMAKKWRFELFYFDFSFGVVLTGVIAAFTLGSMGDDLSFTDNLLIAGKRQITYALAAGILFNLANMLLMAAISLVGMAVAFPAGLGLGLVIGVIWNYILNPQGSAFLLFSGVILVLAAIIVVAFAYRAHAEDDGEITEDFNLKGLIIALVSGLLMGSFYPLVEMSRASPDIGLGPYSVVFFFSLGVFFSTAIYNLYFMNLPVEGEPVSFGQYFTDGSFRKHFLGVLGGILWCTGMLANLLAASSTAKVGPAVSYAMGQGATLIAALWGLLVWKEFAGAEMRVKLLLTIMIVLFGAGLGLVSIAPVYLK
jgi:glucose uptake protein